MEAATHAFLSGLAGALVAYVGAILKDFVSARSKIDAGLLKKRTELYQELWSETKAVTKFPPSIGLQAQDLHRYRERLTAWYYGPGGLMLSRGSQRKYVALQEAIAAAIEAMEKHHFNEDYKGLEKAGSALRTSLTDDIYSRRMAPYVFRAWDRWGDRSTGRK
jgi:hypothetical protein